MNIIDTSIVVVYLLICLTLGLRQLRKLKTLQDYTFGSKPLATMVLIATTFTASIGAKNVIGNVGKVYEMGVTFVAMMLLLPLGWFMIAKLIANNIEIFHQKKFLTLGDIIEHYYGKLGRYIASLGSVVLTLGVASAGSVIIGKLCFYFFNIPELAGIVIVLGIVTVYTTIGGFDAVVPTHVFQFCMFFIIIPIACTIGYYSFGGYQDIVKALPPSHLTVASQDLDLLLGLVVFALTPVTCVPYIQRALVAKNKEQLKTGFNATGLLMIPLFLMLVLMGLMTYIHNPNLEPDTVLFYYIRHYLPIGAAGLTIAGLLAIIMSTQDSFLNPTSTLIARDICKQIWPNLTEREELLIARLSCVLLAFLSVLLVFTRENVVPLIWLVFNFWDPLVGIPLLLALSGIRIKKMLFFIIPIVTILSQIIARFVIGEFDVRTTAIGIMMSIIVTLVMSRFKL